MKALKLKALLVVGLLSAGLVGCAIDKGKIEECVKICAPNEGMLNVQDGPFDITCRCVNGLTKRIPK